MMPSWSVSSRVPLRRRSPIRCAFRSMRSSPARSRNRPTHWGGSDRDSIARWQGPAFPSLASGYPGTSISAGISRKSRFRWRPMMNCGTSRPSSVRAGRRDFSASRITCSRTTL